MIPTNCGNYHHILNVYTLGHCLYSVTQLTPAINNPRDEHMVATKRVLRYLKRWPHLCEVREGFYPSRVYKWRQPRLSEQVSVRFRLLIHFCRRTTAMEFEKATGGALSSCQLEYIALLAHASQKAVRMSDLLSNLPSPKFLVCRSTRITRALFNYKVLRHLCQGLDTYVRDTILYVS